MLRRVPDLQGIHGVLRRHATNILADRLSKLDAYGIITGDKPIGRAGS